MSHEEQILVGIVVTCAAARVLRSLKQLVDSVGDHRHLAIRHTILRSQQRTLPIGKRDYTVGAAQHHRNEQFVPPALLDTFD